MPSFTRPRGVTRRQALVAVAALGLALFAVSTQVCLSSGFRYGLWVNQCPDGQVIQTVGLSANTLTRARPSWVQVEAIAHYTTGKSDARHTENLSSFTTELAVFDGTHVVPLAPLKAWQKSGTGRSAMVTLPHLPDGDYLLRATVTSSLGTTTLDSPLPLYAPARIHVLTDRPLYEPGNVVKFRALALKGNDLTPLDGRPGTWRVTNPSGEVLLEEKAPAGAWGVASGSFPLDGEAESGAWSVAWASGGTVETRTFEVHPFTLPRFHVEASPQKPFYRRGERPVIDGEVRYASGAPVAGAKLEVRYGFAGDWPPPTAWVEMTALPRQATTDGAGAFRLTLPPIPEDLVNTVNINLAIAAVDESGDRVEAGAAVLLAQDAIAVSAVTELAGGLVQGLNNRLYLKATTVDGRLLDGVTLNVKRLWEPTDKGTDAQVDEDGVASLQVDPGPAVNVVVPPLPFRPPPRARPVTRNALSNHLAFQDNEATLGDRLVFDRLEPRLAGCARYANGGGAVSLGMAVSAAGSVLSTGTSFTRLGACVTQALQSATFPAGRERLFEVSFVFDDSDLPSLQAQPEGVPGVPERFNEALEAAVAEARDCLPSSTRSGELSRMAGWSFDGKGTTIALRWIPSPVDASERLTLSGEAQGCIEGRLKSLSLKRARGEEPDAEQEAGSSVGTVRFTVTAPAKYEASRPQATIREGYEFLVSARRGKEVLGQTKLFVEPGQVPMLRLRASPQIAQPRDTIAIEVLRGPDFQGELPKALRVAYGFETHELPLVKETRSAQWTVPEGLSGWARVWLDQAQVMVFITPRASLGLSLKAEKPRYAPGQLAHLELLTTVDGRPGAAAVGLFGVDESLAQLAPLPGADELGGLRPKPTYTAAFPGIDAQALAQGRVRGANAAAATLLKVSAAPQAVQLDSPVAVRGATNFDPNEALTDHFYAVLSELHVQTRQWEATAPRAEKMKPGTMAALWEKSLDALEAKKENVRDGYGRRLKLHRLPSDLLELTEPRQVVLDGTRMPEDVENWAQFIAREKP